jgi:hypothetical protein
VRKRLRKKENTAKTIARKEECPKKTFADAALTAIRILLEF